MNLRVCNETLFNFVKYCTIGSLSKVELGKSKGKPGNSLKSLNQADKQPYSLVYHKLKKWAWCSIVGAISTDNKVLGSLF